MYLLNVIHLFCYTPPAGHRLVIEQLYCPHLMGNDKRFKEFYNNLLAKKDCTHPHFT